ncbi:hypothetical protein [Burkholderia sp. WSM2232]|uniref:hypothetical protein n=1 Tax=Burkholderia sp. WSM2232 TaxID=944436 RepID=UPI0004877DB5|nr:hypothetical protein [Burkholderia sp. WSM2232]
MKLLLALVAVLMVARGVLACSIAENTVLDALQRDIKTSIENPGATSVVDFQYVSPACKAWSQKPEYGLVVKPYVYQTRTDSQRYFGMVAAVVSERTGNVVGAINDRQLMVVDAIEPNAISVDTANYAISPGNLAFGVRTQRQNHSSAVPVREELMSMYALEQGRLRKVVDALVMSSDNGEGGAGCDFSGIMSSSTLDVLKTMNNGHFDLRVRVKKNRTRFKRAGTQCTLTKLPLMTHDYILRFNGTSYEIPKYLQGAIN